MKILSVSIAAYNVEKYLEHTLMSLADSRYREDIEVLVIDDGSKDNTETIATAFEERYPETFKYVKKENGGHGSTINKGIELAKGEYFRVIDGDDYVNQDAFFEYINRLKKCDASMVLTNLYAVDDFGTYSLDPAMTNRGEDVFKNIKERVHIPISCFTDTRLFGLSTITIKTSLLQKNHIHITEKCYYVDAEFVIWCIRLSEDIEFWNLRVYMYRKSITSDNSVNKKNMLKNVDMQKKVSLNMLQIYKQYKESEKNLANHNKLVFKRIIISTGATIRTYMLIQDAKECKQKIREFDKELHEIYTLGANKLSSDWFIRAVRFGNYFGVNLISKMYRFWIERR